jgi:DNA-binding response OmpR family regulator
MAARKTLLIVDDDNELRSALAEQFMLAEGFDVIEADGGKAGLALALEGKADLILLDIDMPDMNGREVCRELRRQNVRLPVIMLTGQSGEDDTVSGLDAGANDYVAKPFRFAVLLARVRAQLRSFEHSEDATFAIGPYEFRPSMKLLVTGEGKKVRLTEKETNILKYLYRAGTKPVARDTLLAEVWGYNAQVTTHTLETHIYRLRQKIEPNPAEARLLITDAGGYRLQP